MDQIPIINQLPEHYRGWALIAVWAFPYLTRGIQSLSAGAGIVGAIRGVLFGTNMPKQSVADTKASDIETHK